MTKCLNYPCFICKQHQEHEEALGSYALLKLFMVEIIAGMRDKDGFVDIDDRTRIKFPEGISDDGVEDIIVELAKWE